MFGVTGTLDSLTDFEKGVLRKFNIEKQTCAPSVYGSSKRIDLPVIIEENQGGQFYKVAEKVSECTSKGIPMLVFFNQ